MKEYLIADSGGTRTDWCFVDKQGIRTFFETESYHPVNWSATFLERIAKDWSSRPKMLNAEVHFFGAGCFNGDNAIATKQILKNLGFQEVFVKSDLHGAGLACLGRKNGWVAILGTGSVLFEWTGTEVGKLIGGKGHVSGDEGSAYYFGKLLLEALEHGELSEDDRTYVLNKVDWVHLKEEINQGKEKYALSALAGLLGMESRWRKWHSKNIQLFCDSHLNEIKIEELHFVGSYAFYSYMELQQILGKRGVKCIKPIAKPIDQIVEQTVLFIE